MATTRIDADTIEISEPYQVKLSDLEARRDNIKARRLALINRVVDKFKPRLDRINQEIDDFNNVP